MGLPGHRFTARSSRITLATTGQVVAATAAEINAMGGWASGSSVAAGIYAKGSADNCFSMAAKGGDAVTVRHIRKRLRSSGQSKGN